MGAMNPFIEQNYFRIRDDTTGANPGTPNWITTENQSTRETIDVSGGDDTIRIRFVMSNSGSALANSNFELYASKNSGSYARVETSGTVGVLLSTAASSSSDETQLDTANFQLTAGTGTAAVGDYDDGATNVGVLDNLSAGDYWELEFGLNLDSANLSDGDTFDFRVYYGGAAPDQVDTNSTALIDVSKSVNTNVAADAGSFTLTGQSASIKTNTAIAAAAGSFTLSGFESTVIPAVNVPLDAGSFTLTGFDTTEQIGVNVDAAAGAFTFNGFDATVSIASTTALDAGSFTLTGYDATVQQGTAIAADAGSFALTGYDVSATVDYTITSDAGSFTLVGHDLTVAETVPVSLDSGSFALTGNDCSVDLAVNLALGSFTVTGYDATVLESAIIPAAVGSFVLNGSAIAVDFGVLPGAGSFTLTGYDATVDSAAQTVVAADAGSFILTGHDATVNVPIIAALQSGAYVFDGLALTISQAVTSTNIQKRMQGTPDYLIDSRLNVGGPVTENKTAARSSTPTGNFTKRWQGG